MKKYTLLIAAAVIASQTVQAETTIYGKANVSLQSVTVEDSTLAPNDVVQDNWELLSNASRIGFKGSSDLEDGLKAVYKLEYETSFDDGDKSGQTFTQRNIYIGLQHELGTIIAGMHDTPVKMIGKPVDVFSDYKLGDIKNSVEGENRDQNMVMFRSEEVMGVKVDVMFSPGEEAGGDDPANSDDLDGPADQISAAVTYKSEIGLKAALGIDSEVDNRDLQRLVVSYDADSWGVAVMGQNAEEVDAAGTEEESSALLSGYYKMGKWKFKGLYSTAAITEDATDDVDVSQFVIGADYKLAKKTKVFGYLAMVEEEIDNAARASIEESTFGVGLEHKF